MNEASRTGGPVVVSVRTGLSAVVNVCKGSAKLRRLYRFFRIAGCPTTLDIRMGTRGGQRVVISRLVTGLWVSRARCG